MNTKRASFWSHFAHATFGLYLIHAAAIIGIVVTWATQYGSTIGDAFAVDLTKWIAIAWAIAQGLYALGKGIRDGQITLPSTTVTAVEPSTLGGTVTTTTVVPHPPSLATPPAPIVVPAAAVVTVADPTVPPT